MKGYLVAFCAAVLWVTGALAVAFPEYIFNADIHAMSQHFFNGSEKIPVSVVVPILLVVDLVIGVFFLKDAEIQRQFAAQGSLSIILLAVLAYIVLAFGVPAFRTGGVGPHATAFALCALLCIVVVRALTYAKPRVFRPIEEVISATGKVGP